MSGRITGLMEFGDGRLRVKRGDRFADVSLEELEAAERAGLDRGRYVGMILDEQIPGAGVRSLRDGRAPVSGAFDEAGRRIVLPAEPGPVLHEVFRAVGDRGAAALPSGLHLADVAGVGPAGARGMMGSARALRDAVSPLAMAQEEATRRRSRMEDILERREVRGAEHQVVRDQLAAAERRPIVAGNRVVDPVRREEIAPEAQRPAVHTAGDRAFRQTGVDERGMPTYEEVAPRQERFMAGGAGFLDTETGRFIVPEASVAQKGRWVENPTNPDLWVFEAADGRVTPFDASPKGLRLALDGMNMLLIRDMENNGQLPPGTAARLVMHGLGEPPAAGGAGAREAAPAGAGGAGADGAAAPARFSSEEEARAAGFGAGDEVFLRGVGRVRLR